MTAKPIAILPIAPTSTEVDEMMSVTKKAFGPDPLIEFCFNQPNVPHPPKEESIAKHLERMSSPDFVYHKAVDAENPSGPILGVAAWYWVEDVTAAVMTSILWLSAARPVLGSLTAFMVRPA